MSIRLDPVLVPQKWHGLICQKGRIRSRIRLWAGQNVLEVLGEAWNQCFGSDPYVFGPPVSGSVVIFVRWHLGSHWRNSRIQIRTKMSRIRNTAWNNANYQRCLVDKYGICFCTHLNGTSMSIRCAKFKGFAYLTAPQTLVDTNLPPRLPVRPYWLFCNTFTSTVSSHFGLSRLGSVKNWK